MKIVPYGPEHVPAVLAFNRRLEEGGVQLFRLQETGVCPPVFQSKRNRIAQENCVAIDTDGMVRGGYTLVRVGCLIEGSPRVCGYLQLPLSEGVIDPRFAMLGGLLVHDCTRREKLLFGLGMGGFDRPLPTLYKAIGAELRGVPFFFRVLNAGRFLRNCTALRTSALRRIGADIAASTLAGGAGIAALNVWVSRKAPRLSSYRVEVVPRFEESWCDAIWDAVSPRHSFICVRDAETLEHIFAGHPGFPVFRLRVSANGKTVGWAVVLAADLKDHNYFPNMRLGSIVDCLALPGQEGHVIAAASRFLDEEKKADVIISNHMHSCWQTAMDLCGFLRYRTNFIFAATRPLYGLLKATDPGFARAHLNRGDGDGPYNLY